MERIPELAPDLVDALDREYPPHDSYELTFNPLEEIRARAAQRCMIDRLRRMQTEAQEDSLASRGYD